MKAMRIHQYGDAGTVRLEDVPPLSISDDQIYVRVHGAGVNPIDWKIREGYLQQVMPVSFLPTIGQDFAGEVADTMSLSKAGNAKELSQTGQNSRQSNPQGCIKFGFQKEADASSRWASQPTYFSEGNYGREVERGYRSDASGFKTRIKEHPAWFPRFDAVWAPTLLLLDSEGKGASGWVQSEELRSSHPSSAWASKAIPWLPKESKKEVA